MSKPVTIVIAEDDADDRMLIADAFAESKLPNPIHFVEHGEELLQYLRREGKYAEMLAGAANPGLILLDLNMPRMDGRTALAAIKADTKLRRIPIVVMTTSREQEDVFRTYDLGVNSFISKPVTYEALLDIVRTVGNYWINMVRLPDGRS